MPRKKSFPSNDKKWSVGFFFSPCKDKKKQSNMSIFDVFILIYSRFPNEIKKQVLGSGELGLATFFGTLFFKMTKKKKKKI